MKSALDDLGEIMDLELHPFGNAYYPESVAPGSCPGSVYDLTAWNRTDEHCWLDACAGSPFDDKCFKGTPLCQHGSRECDLNVVEGCALKAFPDAAKEVFSFFYCIEQTVQKLPESVPPEVLMRICAGESKLTPPDPIFKCFEDPVEAAAVARQHAAATVVFGTKREGVPYVLVAGKEVENPMDTKELTSAICTAYTGADIPSTCNSL